MSKNNLYVTVGIPGTGKSYQLIKKVVESLESLNERSEFRLSYITFVLYIV